MWPRTCNEGTQDTGHWLTDTGYWILVVHDVGTLGSATGYWWQWILRNAPTVELKYANATDPPDGAVVVPAPGGSNAHYTSALAGGKWTRAVETGSETLLACITMTDS